MQSDAEVFKRISDGDDNINEEVVLLKRMQKIICNGMIRLIALLLANRSRLSEKSKNQTLDCLVDLGGKCIELVKQQASIMQLDNTTWVTFTQVYRWYAHVCLSHTVWGHLHPAQQKTIMHLTSTAKQVLDWCDEADIEDRGIQTYWDGGID